MYLVKGEIVFTVKCKNLSCANFTVYYTVKVKINNAIYFYHLAFNIIVYNGVQKLPDNIVF